MTRIPWTYIHMYQQNTYIHYLNLHVLLRRLSHSQLSLSCSLILIYYDNDDDFDETTLSTDDGNVQINLFDINTHESRRRIYLHCADYVYRAIVNFFSNLNIYISYINITPM